MIDWRSGDKLICIRVDGDFDPEEYGDEVPPIFLEVGKLYTLYEIGNLLDFGHDHDDGDIYVTVHEADPDGTIFNHRCFEKTIDKKAATELFERLCLTAKHDEKIPERMP